MRAFLTGYARAVGGLGFVLLVSSLIVDTRWLGQAWGIMAMLATIVFLRAQQIPLTKYGALNLLALPIVSGALILGASMPTLTCTDRRYDLASSRTATARASPCPRAES